MGFWALLDEETNDHQQPTLCWVGRSQKQLSPLAISDFGTHFTSHARHFCLFLPKYPRNSVHGGFELLNSSLTNIGKCSPGFFDSNSISSSCRESRWFRTVSTVLVRSTLSRKTYNFWFCRHVTKRCHKILVINHFFTNLSCAFSDSIFYMIQSYFFHLLSSLPLRLGPRLRSSQGFEEAAGLGLIGLVRCLPANNNTTNQWQRPTEGQPTDNNGYRTNASAFSQAFPKLVPDLVGGRLGAGRRAWCCIILPCFVNMLGCSKSLQWDVQYAFCCYHCHFFFSAFQARLRAFCGKALSINGAGTLCEM